MNTYFIFYTDTLEIIATYQADQVDLARYVVLNRTVNHARAIEGATPHDCQLQQDPIEKTLWLAKPVSV